MSKEAQKFTKDDLDILNGITSSRHGYIIPFSLDPLLDAMTVQERGFTHTAIRHYVKTGEVLEVNEKSFPYVALKQFIEQYGRDAPKYLTTTRQNRENGSKGGKAKVHNAKDNTNH